MTDPDRASPQRQQLIVLADDDVNLRKALERMLTPLARVLVASNGAEALKLVIDQAPTVLLSDLEMPETSGLEVLHALRERRDPVRCILMSGGWTPDAQLEALQAGVFLLLAKPFSQHLLTQAVRLALNDAA